MFAASPSVSSLLPAGTSTESALVKFTSDLGMAEYSHHFGVLVVFLYLSV